MPLTASAWDAVSGQAAEGQFLPIGAAQPQPDQEQPVGLDGPPVAQPLEGAVRLGQVCPVPGQALVDAAAKGRRHSLPEQAEGAQPIFGAQAGFQRPPGGVLAGGGAGHTVQPAGEIRAGQVDQGQHHRDGRRKGGACAEIALDHAGRPASRPAWWN